MVNKEDVTKISIIEFENSIMEEICQLVNNIGLKEDLIKSSYESKYYRDKIIDKFSEIRDNKINKIINGNKGI